MLGLRFAGGPVILAGAVMISGARAPTPGPAAACAPGTSVPLKIAATTDVHGHLQGWDYYADRADSDRGLTRAATIVDSLRAADRGRVVLVDAGDILQGTPLAYVAARVVRAGPNPIIAAMNAMRYDAAAVGNHEFNYGVAYLDSAVSQARFPFLAANATSGGHARSPRFALIRRAGATVGIVGATTPGSDLWDAAHLSTARLHINDIVPAVGSAVAEARAAGADVVVVVLHSGLDEPSSYDTVATGVASENVSSRVAREVAGIDVIVYGHSHRENPGTVIGQTLLIQPKNWATSVAIATIPLSCSASGRWKTGIASGTLVKAAGHAEDATVLRAVDAAHRETLAYVNSVIGTTQDEFLADSGRVRPTALAGFILSVERRAAGAQLASTAIFDTAARLGPGPITVAQLARLYPYDNTLRAIRISGAQLRAYLEHSSRYYRTESSGALVPDSSVAGYNFDVVSGVDYRIDVTQPVGRRITSLKWQGKEVFPIDTFTLALNNYRQTGGGGYSMLRGAPVVYDHQQEIRQLLTDEVRRLGRIRATDYDNRNWSLAGPSRTP